MRDGDTINFTMNDREEPTCYYVMHSARSKLQSSPWNGSLSFFFFLNSKTCLDKPRLLPLVMYVLMTSGFTTAILVPLHLLRHHFHPVIPAIRSAIPGLLLLPCFLPIR